MNLRLVLIHAFILCGLLAGGCRSFDKSVQPLITPTAPAGYKPPIYMTGTKPLDQADPGKMNVDVWKVNSDRYPDSIHLFVRVYDNEGKLITNLAPPYYKGSDDYKKIWSGLTERIGEDGRDSAIRDFTVREFSDQDGIPYELALALDYSGTMGTNILGLEQAASAFVKLKRTQDRIAVVKFDKAPKLVAPSTSSESELLAKFDGTGLKGYGGYTALYEAAKLGAQQLVTAPADHPRAVVLFTDGEDNASTVPVPDLYRYCRENSIPVFTVAFGAINQGVLQDIATYTGGRFYQTYTAEELKSAFEDIYRSLRNYYLLSYKPLNLMGKHIARLTLDPPNGGGKQLAATATYNALTGIVAAKPAFTLDTIYFAYNKSDLLPESEPAIAAIASVMQDLPRLELEVQGHTDARGTEEYNMKLSQARAESVRNALITRGIDPSRLRARGFGFSVPKASNDTDEGRQKNRRTEFQVLRL